MIPRPAGTGSSLEAENQVEPREANGPCGRETVLVVEDDDQVRAVAGAILRSGGYRVLTAATADQALTLAAGRAEPIHLLLTDVLLPCMTGRQLAKRLTHDRPGLRVMFISGYSREALAEKGLLEPSVVLLEKPFRVDEMLHQVRRLLDADKTFRTAHR